MGINKGLSYLISVFKTWQYNVSIVFILVLLSPIGQNIRFMNIQINIKIDVSGDIRGNFRGVESKQEQRFPCLVIQK